MKKVFAIILGCVFSVFIGEVTVRAVEGNLFNSKNYLFQELSPAIASDYKYDEWMGWTTRPSAESTRGLPQRPEFYRWSYLKRSFDSKGFRQHKSPLIKNQGGPKKILALGDSFTIGGEVNDEETWPFYLEVLLGLPVLNSGVSRYGLDQMILKLEKELPSVRPSHVILSITPFNIYRCGLNALPSSGRDDILPKPFFLVSDEGELKLTKPEIRNNSGYGVSGIRFYLGHSLLVHKLMKLFFFQYWFGVPKPETDLPKWFHTRQDSVSISCALISKFKELSKLYHFKPLILSQEYYEHQLSSLDVYRGSKVLEEVKKCIVTLKIGLIDSRPFLEDLWRSNPNEYKTLFFPGAHMTNRGNLKIAELIRQSLIETEGNGSF
jgi:hypothetical protein